MSLNVSSLLVAASDAAPALETIATPTLWWATIAAILVLLAFDFVVTRKPHEVHMKEAIGWSVFYIALPVAFGGWIWAQYGSEPGIRYYSGYLVEKSLSVDNLFVFIVILASFAVPRELRQKVLLWGVVGALVMRGIFIAVGAGLIANFAWIFFVFGAILAATAVKVVKDALKDDHDVDAGNLLTVRIIRRFWPVTENYVGAKLSVKENGKRMLTPLAVVVGAIMGTDLLFAVDSVPAVYGITSDPYLVFATNAFALLGLRALYFVLEGSLKSLRYLPWGLGAILAFISVKLVLHGAHKYIDGVPEVPATASLLVIVGILVVTIVASLMATARDKKRGVAKSDAEVGAEVGVTE